MVNADAAPGLAVAAWERVEEIVSCLRQLDAAALLLPSELPDWDRLTIVCHLRYGALAFARMIQDTLAGRATSYYPEGRERQRPRTLVPSPGESADDVVAALYEESRRLHEAERGLTSEEWSSMVTEPRDNPDLGPVVLSMLPLMRTTEVEVHGTDLGVGLPDWSDTFVSHALPFRMEWLNTRRSNHKKVDNSIQGSWLLGASDGPSFLVTVIDEEVRTKALSELSGVRADATIEGTSRDLLALLLGRPATYPLRATGDLPLAAAFSRAFPGP